MCKQLEPVVQAFNEAERKDESVNNDRTPTEKPRVSDTISVQQCNSKDAVILTSNCVTNIVAITYSKACRTDKAESIGQIQTACENALRAINKVGE